MSQACACVKDISQLIGDEVCLSGDSVHVWECTCERVPHNLWSQNNVSVFFSRRDIWMPSKEQEAKHCGYKSHLIEVKAPPTPALQVCFGPSLLHFKYISLLHKCYSFTRSWELWELKLN